MTDIWEEVPRNEYYQTFKEVVNCAGFGLNYEGDIFSTKEENDNVINYFYELEGKFYVQNYEVHEVKSMKIKREEDRKILAIGLHENAGHEYEFERIRRKELKEGYIGGIYYCFGYDYRYKIYLNDKQVKVERLGILFPPEMKRKTILL